MIFQGNELYRVKRAYDVYLLKLNQERDSLFGSQVENRIESINKEIEKTEKTIDAIVFEIQKLKNQA